MFNCNTYYKELRLRLTHLYSFLWKILCLLSMEQIEIVLNIGFSSIDLSSYGECGCNGPWRNCKWFKSFYNMASCGSKDVKCTMGYIYLACMNCCLYFELRLSSVAYCAQNLLWCYTEFSWSLFDISFWESYACKTMSPVEMGEKYRKCHVQLLKSQFSRPNCFSSVQYVTTTGSLSFVNELVFALHCRVDNDFQMAKSSKPVFLDHNDYRL